MEINWGTVISLAVTLIIQAGAFVWFVAKMHSELKEMHETLEATKSLPDRVLKLEWETSQTKSAFVELKEIHQRSDLKLSELTLLLHEMRKDIEHNKCANR